MGQRLDTYDRLPSGMKEYLSQYGWQFLKKDVRVGRIENEGVG